MLMYTNLFGLKLSLLRYFNVYGNRQPIKGQYAPVIGIFLRQFVMKNHLRLLVMVNKEETLQMY